MNKRAYDNIGRYIMKKSYKMENLDCANCAAKMETAISKIPGVESVSVNFLMQKITIAAEKDAMPEILKKADECCRKVERNCRIIY